VHLYSTLFCTALSGILCGSFWVESTTVSNRM